MEPCIRGDAPDSPGRASEPDGLHQRPLLPRRLLEGQSDRDCGASVEPIWNLRFGILESHLEFGRSASIRKLLLFKAFND